MKPFSFYVPIWDTYLYVLPHTRKLKHRLKRLGVKRRQVKFAVKGRYDATTLSADAASIIVLQKGLSRRTKTDALAHEIFHVAQDILEERGVHLKKHGTNEAHAYLVGYLTRKALKRMRK